MKYLLILSCLLSCGCETMQSISRGLGQGFTQASKSSDSGKVMQCNQNYGMPGSYRCQ